MSDRNEHTETRPEIHLNVAMSLDGKIALATGEATKLSCEADFRRVFQLRNRADAILVGINTVLNDDPKLTVKEEFLPAGETVSDPLRVVLDSQCRTPEDSYVLDGRAPTLIATASGHHRSLPNADIVECGDDNGRVDIYALLRTLTERGVEKLMVEGGSEVLASFIFARLFDIFTVYIASRIIGGPTAPTLIGGRGARRERDLFRLHLESAKPLGEGVLLTYTYPSTDDDD